MKSSTKHPKSSARDVQHPSAKSRSTDSLLAGQSMRCTSDKHRSAKPTPWKAIVAYFDLLGTSNRFPCNVSINQEIQEAQKLYSAMRAVRKILENSGENNKVKWDSYTSSLLSDSVFMIRKLAPLPDNFEGDTTFVLDDIAQCQTELLKRGYVCRGGVDVGPVFFQRNFICGSGLVSTHSLDCKGQGPFVFVPRRFVEFLYRASCRMKAQPTIDDFFLLDSDYDHRLIYLQDSDRFVLNYMSEWYLEDDFEQLLDIQRQLILDNLIRSRQDKRAREIYEMLRCFHNYVLTLLDDRAVLDRFSIHEIDSQLFSPAKPAVQNIVETCDSITKQSIAKKAAE